MEKLINCNYHILELYHRAGQLHFKYFGFSQSELRAITFLSLTAVTLWQT